MASGNYEEWFYSQQTQYTHQQLELMQLVQIGGSDLSSLGVQVTTGNNYRPVRLEDVSSIRLTGLTADENEIAWLTRRVEEMCWRHSATA